jgi:hypothetical protein
VKVEGKVRRERKPVRGEEEIGIWVGKVLSASKVAEHSR